MSDINLGIGPLVKKYRTIKGYSIRELARNINVTASMLSQIERDIVNPSINTLKAISVELGVPMYKFFMNDEDEQKLRLFGRATINCWEVSMSMLSTSSLHQM